MNKASILISIFSLLTLFSAIPVLRADYQVQRVDFLSQMDLKINAAGPLLVMCDDERNRIIQVNTHTASVSVIDGATHKVVNIPIKSRVPQHFKMEALNLNPRTGDIYVIGNHSLHIVFPENQKATTIDTIQQYEMVAVNEKNGDAFLVGRESRFLAFVSLKTLKVKRIPWVNKVEKAVNLNATPPPPIRKVVCDSSLNRVVALDGFTATCQLFSASTGKFIKKRNLPVKAAARWHMAGYNDKTHHLYTVIETEKRQVIQALKLDVAGTKDIVVELPGFKEGVGITYNSIRDEIYIPYDNDPSVHVVQFKDKQALYEIKVPAFGNDATALDEKNALLYVSSWAYGEVEILDLKSRRMIKRIKETGIIPHMFSMAFNSKNGKLYIPIGATAVNGSFGTALTVLDPTEQEKKRNIHTGWAPVALTELQPGQGFMVFNSENQAAQVTPDGKSKIHQLPAQCRFVNNAVTAPDGTIQVSYGPHQSYWPTVYIWAARNGILGITPQPDLLHFYDRRIPRMAQQMAFDKNGVLYALQNNWGKEKQFLVTFPDAIRIPNLGSQRLVLEDDVSRETTQRILKYDPQRHWLYIVRTGETDDEPGILQILDLETKKTRLKYPTGRTPTDLLFDQENIFITNFDDNTITALNKDDYSVQKLKTDDKPFKLAMLNNILYCINHNSNTIQSFESSSTSKTFALPVTGKPSNLFSTGEFLVITSHSPTQLNIIAFHPQSTTFELIHTEKYPYGETTVDTNNSSFYMRGQFADGIYQLTQIKKDKTNCLWITDYLSGKLFIISRQ
jgi:DNA-binding beta-propeller fold protein YncE